MNLHGIVSGVISAVNPMIPVTVQVSLPPTLNAARKPIAQYGYPQIVPAQIQPLTWRDIQQLDGINLGGVRWKVYLYGQVDGLVRPERKGGDLIIIAAGRHQGTWLVAQVLEQWPDFVLAAITQQNGS
jgi:hypothetical protein